jgi:hypothetical protein
VLAPFAEYTLTAKPDWLRTSLRTGETLALDPSQRTTVSRREGDEIFVQGDERLFALGWGGTRNHMVSWEGDAWVVHHLGHQSPIWINNQPNRGRRHTLASGDRIAPALGVVFTFRLRPDLEPIAQEVSRLEGALRSDERVLSDWLMERTSMDREAALLACRHFKTRTGAGRTG